MRKILLAAGAMLALAAGPAIASTTVADAKGDFLSGYTGPKTDDLDVLSFYVAYDASAQMFDLRATMAGDIDPANGPGFYVIGINTGTGVNHPFGPVGQGNVLFNQAMVIQKTGAGAITVPVLGAQSFMATISGNTFEAFIPLSFLPTTGFIPRNYGFSIWPRQVTGGLLALADFAPENSTIAPIPEPAAWALMIGGFGFTGGVLRRRRSAAVPG